jgi:hypothetical protein
VMEISVQKFLECFDDRSLAEVPRIESGSQPVFFRVVRVSGRTMMIRTCLSL